MQLRHPYDRPTAPRAFTLIEVLIATVIFAAVVAALNTVFYGAFKLRASTTKLLEDSIPMNHAASIIKSDLRNVVAPGLTVTNPITTTVTSVNTSMKGAVGGGSGLDYLELYTSTALTDNERPWSDVQKVSYYLKQSDIPLKVAGKDLIRAVTRNLLPTMEQDITEQVLLSGVGLLEFSFFDGTEWRDLWDTATEQESQQQTEDQTQTQTQPQGPLPLAVRVRVEFAAENGARNSLRIDQLPLEILAPIIVQGRTNAVTQTSTASATQPAGNGGANTGGGNTGGGNTGGGGGNTGGGANTGGGRGGGGRGGG